MGKDGYIQVVTFGSAPDPTVVENGSSIPFTQVVHADDMHLHQIPNGSYITADHAGKYLYTWYAGNGVNRGGGVVIIGGGDYSVTSKLPFGSTEDFSAALYVNNNLVPTSVGVYGYTGIVHLSEHDTVSLVNVSGDPIHIVRDQNTPATVQASLTMLKID